MVLQIALAMYVTLLQVIIPVKRVWTLKTIGTALSQTREDVYECKIIQKNIFL